MVTQQRLKELFTYDPDTGLFTRLVSVNNRSRAGAIAGSKGANGYIVISVDSRRYYAHVLAWIYTYGEPPTNEIDHIDRDDTNNRISNLRDITHSENCKNRVKPSNTGHFGVWFNKKTGRYRATANNRYVGYFSSAQEASEAVTKALAVPICA